MAESATQVVQTPSVPDSAVLDPDAVAAVARGPAPLGRMTTQWLVGDWDSLARLDAAQIEAHPHRDRVALLVACAHLQRDDRARAERHLRDALAWGCDARLVARLLISGVHNSLGRIAALRQDTPGIEAQFREALRLTGDADIATAAHSRAVREMTTLGLLPQAAGLLAQRSASLDEATQRPTALSAEVSMLRSEVELLQHELALVLERNRQAFRPGRSAETAGQTQPAGELERLRALSPSQLGQDLWVIERTGCRRGGYFVEFGAADGLRLSNTWLLETELGWQGICAEPNPKYFDRLGQNRRCRLSSACVGPVSGEQVEFVLAEEYGGMVRDMDHDHNADKRRAYHADASRRTVFTTVSLEDLLLQMQAPREIDYLSIDTEGSEFDILAAFPFERWTIRLITVEHNFSANRQRLHDLLTARGYVRTEAQWDDWYELT